MKSIVAALAVVGVAMAGPAMAQTKPKAAAPAAKAAAPAKAPAYKAPRGPDGKHPDLNGVWQVMNTAGWDIEPHAARAALQLRPGPFVPVPAKAVLALGAVGAVPAGLGIVEGGEIPYKPEAKKVRDENRANYLDRDPEVKCYLPGVPRANYMHLPFQIFQSEKSMIIAYEYAGAVRNVLFNDPGPAPVDSWMGQSVAKWDGDTLVVTVSGMLDRTWFDRAGNHHSDQMTVVDADRPGRDALRGHDHRSRDVHPSLEDELQSLQACRRRRAPEPVQVRRVCRGTDVRRPAQGTAEVRPEYPAFGGAE